MKTVHEIKASLKAAFPGTKFQVRNRRGTIHVYWEDGASWADVNRAMPDAVCSKFTTKEEENRLVAYCREHLQGADGLTLDSQMRWAEMHMANPGADSITISWR